MTHHKVESQNAGVEVSPTEVFEQLAAGRVAMAQLYDAINVVAKVVNTHDENGRAVHQRLDEQPRMWMDDHRPTSER